MKSTENRATIYDVAKLAKVSAATVSRVLKGDSSVNASTYRRVEDAAAALKYERRLRQYPPQNCLIVLNVPTLNNAFYSRIISGAQDAAATEGYHVLVNAQQINEVNVEAFLAMLRGVKAVGLIELNALTTDIAGISANRFRWSGAANTTTDSRKLRMSALTILKPRGA